MTVREATDLIRVGVHDGRWADFGAGRGVFTQALAALLGERGSVLAIDRDRDALRELHRIAKQTSRVQVVEGNVYRLEEIPELSETQLDGALFANVLHFIAHPADILARVRACMRPAATVLIIEYDRRASSRWVPYPLPLDHLAALASTVGLSEPVEIGR